MDDSNKKQQPNENSEEHSYFEDTVGMTGPVNITEEINQRDDPELQETENDDVSVITVKNEEAKETPPND